MTKSALFLFIILEESSASRVLREGPQPRVRAPRGQTEGHRVVTPPECPPPHLRERRPAPWCPGQGSSKFSTAGVSRWIALGLSRVHQTRAYVCALGGCGGAGPAGSVLTDDVSLPPSLPSRAASGGCLCGRHQRALPARALGSPAVQQAGAVTFSDKCRVTV